jgi:putative transcriptional regulator
MQGGSMNLGCRLRELRQDRGLTQQALGEAVGVTRQSIISIEQGRYAPSVRLALQLARVLEVRVEDVFWLEEGRGRSGE